MVKVVGIVSLCIWAFICMPVFAEDVLQFSPIPTVTPAPNSFSTKTGDGKIIFYPPRPTTTHREILIPPPADPVIIRNPNGTTQNYYPKLVPVSEGQKMNEAAMRQVVLNFIIQNELIQEKQDGVFQVAQRAIIIRSIVSDKDGIIVVNIQQESPASFSTGFVKEIKNRILVLPKNITAQSIKDAAAAILEKQAAALEEEIKKMQEKSYLLKKQAEQLKTGS